MHPVDAIRPREMVARALIAVPFADSRVGTWRMPLRGVDYSGIWHQRYYGPGTKLAAD